MHSWPINVHRVNRLCGFTSPTYFCLTALPVDNAAPATMAAVIVKNKARFSVRSLPKLLDQFRRLYAKNVVPEHHCVANDTAKFCSFSV